MSQERKMSKNAVPEPKADTTNPSQVAALAQNSQKSSAVSQQESQLPDQAALILSCPVGTTIHLKIEPSQDRTRISVQSQGLEATISNVASPASPVANCRLL